MPLSHLLLAYLLLQAPKPGSVSGTIVNSISGAPVRKAHVTLRYGDATYTAASDAQGHFAIAGVNPGVYNAMVECVGYEVGQRVEPVRVAEDQQVSDLSFSLLPHGVITGKVLDENGDPLPQVQVQAELETYDRNGRTFSSSGITTTDDRGVYRFFDRPAGRYFLRATGSPYAGITSGRLHSDPVEMEYVNTWFPNVLDASQATATQLAAGAELNGIDIHMRKARVYHVRGKVQGPGLQQRLDAPVMLTLCGTQGGWFQTAQILRDGSFDIPGVMPGVWCASLSQTIDSAHGFYARETVTIADHDENGVLLNAVPTAEIRGQVLLDGEVPANARSVTVQLEPLELPGRGGATGIRPDGGFTISNVQPGPYRVSINWPGMYLKSVKLNGQEGAGGRMTVPPAGGQLTALLASDGGQLQGTVQGGAGIVTLAPAGSPGDVRTVPVAMGATSFTITNLAPGDYQALAWEFPLAAEASVRASQFGLLQYAEFRKLFESRAVTVTIHPKGHETVSLTPIPAAEMEIAKARLQ